MEEFRRETARLIYLQLIDRMGRFVHKNRQFAAKEAVDMATEFVKLLEETNVCKHEGKMIATHLGAQCSICKGVFEEC